MVVDVSKQLIIVRRDIHSSVDHSLYSRKASIADNNGTIARIINSVSGITVKEVERKQWMTARHQQLMAQS